MELTKNFASKIHLRKVKSHTGIKGNDKADKLANKSREEVKWEPESLGSTSYNVTLSMIFETSDLEWRNYWASAYQRNPKYNPKSLIRRYVKRANYRIFKCFRGMKRREATTIFKLITEHAPLNYLRAKLGWKHRGFYVHPSCTCCGTYETVEHYLFYCHRFSRERKEMIDRIHDIWMDFSPVVHLNAKFFSLETQLKLI